MTAPTTSCMSTDARSASVSREPAISSHGQQQIMVGYVVVCGGVVWGCDDKRMHNGCVAVQLRFVPVLASIFARETHSQVWSLQPSQQPPWTNTSQFNKVTNQQTNKATKNEQKNEQISHINSHTTTSPTHTPPDLDGQAHEEHHSSEHLRLHCERQRTQPFWTQRARPRTRCCCCRRCC